MQDRLASRQRWLEGPQGQTTCQHPHTKPKPSCAWEGSTRPTINWRFNRLAHCLCDTDVTHARKHTPQAPHKLPYYRYRLLLLI
eukprot:2625264-Amphidinium_carterae.1